MEQEDTKFVVKILEPTGIWFRVSSFNDNDKYHSLESALTQARKMSIKFPAHVYGVTVDNDNVIDALYINGTLYYRE